MESAPSGQPPILVTGATGRHGGTGRAVAEQLIGRGLPVRALVRTPDGRAERLRGLGAEIAIGDYADHASLLAALEGVKAAYFCYPVAAGIAEAAGLFAGAGRRQGLERIVDLSLGSISPDARSPQVRAQWVAEQIFEWAGFGGAHLRVAAFFMENVLLIDGEDIRGSDTIANSFGDVVLDWIAGTDVGAIAAALLADPALAPARTVTVGATQQLSYSGIAGALGAVLGRPIRYQELTPAQWREKLVAAALSSGQSNERGADHLVAQSIMVRSRPPRPLSDDVRRLTGRVPTLFAEFASSRKDELLAPAA